MKVTVYGTGSWGTALAQVLADNGHDVLMYGVDPFEINDINDNHRNSRYFEQLPISEKLRATDDIRLATEGAGAVIIAVPTKFIRSALQKGAPYIGENALIINAAKGFDWEKNCRITDTMREVLAERPHRTVASIIGPSHAEEVIQRMLTCVCAVSLDIDVANEVRALFSNNYMRLYSNTDEVGAEYGAAVKNVIAIASGILVGQGYGDNAKAALVDRGLLEMARYGTSKGGKPETYYGLTGLGDLVVTCFSIHSRNYRCGLAIGKANSAKEVLASNKNTVEGVNSCKVIYEDLANCDFEMPLVEALYRILYCDAVPSEEIKNLMLRPLKQE